MTREFFEGPAGSGKTHSLIERTRELVSGGLLKEGQRILALTFMNGARRRLEASLGKHPELRRKFECKTVDVFAQMVAARRRSLLAFSSDQVEAAAKLNRFDGTCHLASHLLQSGRVAQWVALSYPLVLIDEAQDLNPHRLPILQGLSSACAILAAADEFQCLTDGMDTSPALAWLTSFEKCVRLDGSRRTSQSGILAAARAVRNGTSMIERLTKHEKYDTWSSPGFKLMVVAARNAGFPARTVSNELRQCKGNVAILTPDTGNKTVRDALAMVQTRPWSFSRKNSATFGPYAIEWDVKEEERAQDLCKQLELPNLCGPEHIAAGSGKALGDAALVRVRQRMERAIRVQGERTFSSERVSEMVGDAVRDVSRFGGRRGALRAAMSIHRAKNREFRNVIVLWPYSATGSDGYLRRLLYNAITRAQEKCTVIVLGKKDRVDGPPFAAASSGGAQAAAASRTKSRAPSRHRRKSAAKAER